MRKNLFLYVTFISLAVSLTISGCTPKSKNMELSMQTSSMSKVNVKPAPGNTSNKVPVGLDTASLPGSKDVPAPEGTSSAQPSANNVSEGNTSGTALPIQDKPLYDKEVFLTFDDGPSANTQKILDILKEKGVKASFFVLGSKVEKYPELVKAEYNSGMAVLNHSYSHDYSMYKSVERCMEDFQKSDDVIKSILGVQPLGIIRFPGGSDNSVSNSNTMRDIRNTFVNKGKVYVDWNVSSADAAAATVPADTIKSNVIRQLSNKSFGVVLMHDAPSKTTTVDALPQIIDNLKNQGFVFRTFRDLTPTEENKMIKDRIVNRGLHK